ncbi:hypothetical protein Fuma_02283 [Fuerstiella marisgermanici]|uniref:Uncharacterized protein n=1 Tax=Fuerstiella marisgermanici TaxID=1891926 RepID=A0A1P8WF18_9PLAN|nr:hypothetical protein Fuma_02283 [Fuerstiella marisgermanici]
MFEIWREKFFLVPKLPLPVPLADTNGYVLRPYRANRIFTI